jgi:hypothetical protein
MVLVIITQSIMPPSLLAPRRKFENDAQHNDTLLNSAQHNAIQQNDIRHNSEKYVST